MSHEPTYAPEEGGATGRRSRIVDLLTTYGERAGNALVYSSAYLAAIAMTEVAIAMVLLSLPPNPAPVVVGLVTFAVYTNDRVADADTDAVSDPDRSAFVRRHRGTLYLLASVAYGLAVAISVLGGPVALAVTLLPGAFWVAYAADWVPNLAPRLRRLKEVLVVNSLVVALAWATTVTALPVAFTDAAVTPATAVVFAYFLLRSFVDTEIPNVGDVEADRATDVATLPVAFGVPATRRALYCVDLFTVGLVGVAASTGVLRAGPAVALGVGVAYSLVVTGLLGRADDDAVALASECEYLVVAAALVGPLLIA
ncbi:4-hydroxybenzoate polyprenyltransferase [Halobaculum sp. WSA2]|uniref:4-hydroxybenzoate polyprenyltransferase n=1 Tax=Halobaculum saliterrae TaxID=2073113 RepID=A0A6B0SMU9_9EURY|nr:UbiA family prenyltransferase [Halobaculum saliterrae]MXR40055.1 4-hydroxybenzoate polyprenyltransferase [Halobaculum saliterrae]